MVGAFETVTVRSSGLQEDYAAFVPEHNWGLGLGLGLGLGTAGLGTETCDFSTGDVCLRRHQFY